MRNFTTLFDSAYMAKGLAMYRSLERSSSEEFLLHIIAMDDQALAILHALALKQARIYPVGAFESMMGLTAARSNRSWQEYCWTCASCSMEYLLSWHRMDSLTYLDADLFFFSDPKPVFDEIGTRSIGITPHRFPADRRHMERNGKFNVGWVTLRSDHAGMRCSELWADQCRAWCYARNEGGKFGDQGYLDQWPERYGESVAVIENIGVNAAPWNIAQYEVRAGLCVGDAPLISGVPLVCYHLHEYEHGVRLTNYRISEEVVELIYRPYIRAHIDSESSINGARDRIRAHQQELSTRAESA